MNDGGSDDCGGETGHGCMREISFIQPSEGVDISELGDYGLGIHDSGSRAPGHGYDAATDDGTTDSLSINGPTLDHDDDGLLRHGYPRYYVGNRSDFSTDDNTRIDKYFSPTLGASNDLSSSHSTSSQPRELSRSAQASAVGVQRAIRAIAGQATWLHSHFNSSSLQVVSGKKIITLPAILYITYHVYISFNICISEAIDCSTSHGTSYIAGQLLDSMQGSRTPWAIIAVDKTHIQLSHLCPYKNSNYYCR